MAAARPQVQVYGNEHFEAKDGAQVKMPEVFLAPIRDDIVHFVHTQMAKNNRQAYAVSKDAGHQHSAHSWGTGRAVSRIPRVSGGGTSRAGQAAFGNMCRKGRMFAPTRIWRRWHRKINTNQKRYAVASALAASALPSLVMARGHNIEQVPEVPLVVNNQVQAIKKTRDAVAFLKSVGAYDDVERVKASRKINSGKGKRRNRRHTQKRGPLVVYSEDEGVTRAFRNIPGVELANVESLNLLQLAPGGHLGRFIVWTQAAFSQLADIWGSTKRVSTQKKGYKLPYPIVTNSDIGRIINSNEIQSNPRLRAAIKTVHKKTRKVNPLKNKTVMASLNPYSVELRKTEQAALEAAKKNRAQIIAQRRANQKANAIQKKVNYAKITTDYAVLIKADLDQKIASDLAAAAAAKAAADAAAQAEAEANAAMIAAKKAALGQTEVKAAPAEESEEESDEE